MIHQPPAGTRDLLPLEVAQKGWINDRLQMVFQQWSYQRIVTSTMEWLETLMAGGAIDYSTVFQLQDVSGRILGLRPEVTASIARAAATRMSETNVEGSAAPLRLCYRANVFRNPPASHHGRQVEFYQAGVELLWGGGLLADGEILLLLVDCLASLGLSHWQIILGDVELTRALLAPFETALRRQVRHCIVELDRVSLESLAYPDEAQKRQALSLFDLRGKPADVLETLGTMELGLSGVERVNRLKSFIKLLEASQGEALPIVLDLSLLQRFDYYTGIVFQVVVHQERQWRVLGQGGRYDQLLGLYHPQGQSAPGIGFSLNLEDLHACLLADPNSALPQSMPASDWLVIAQTESAQAAAFAYAQVLRDSEHLVRVEFELRDISPEMIRESARVRSIQNLAWIAEDGTPKIEMLS